MKDTKKLAVTSLLAALSVALMSVGMAVEALDLSACMMASLLVAIVYIEIGSPHVWLLWLVVSLISWIVFQGSVLWLEYFLIFGPYPILKGYIERLPRPFWILVKLAFANAAIWLMIAGSQLVLGLPLFDTQSKWIKIGLYLFLNVVFFAYDLCITACVRFYMEKLRHRFQKFLR